MKSEAQKAKEELDAIGNFLAYTQANIRSIDSTIVENKQFLKKTDFNADRALREAREGIRKEVLKGQPPKLVPANPNLPPNMKQELGIIPVEEPRPSQPKPLPEPIERRVDPSKPHSYQPLNSQGVVNQPTVTSPQQLELSFQVTTEDIIKEVQQIKSELKAIKNSLRVMEDAVIKYININTIEDGTTNERDTQQTKKSSTDKPGSCSKGSGDSSKDSKQPSSRPRQAKKDSSNSL